jgi:hypothetical protein
MEIIPYKSRDVDLSKKVRMYRCLNKKGFVFSLSQKGKVIGHTSDIVLKDCSLIIMESGKNRCLREKQRNVHAFVEGFVAADTDIKLAFSFLLNYNPYEDKKFYTTHFDELSKCEIVYLKNNKIYCQI